MKSMLIVDGRITQSTKMIPALPCAKNLIARRLSLSSQNLSEKGSSYTLSLPDTGFKVDTEVTEIYTCATTAVDHGGNVPVQMVSGEPRILYPHVLHSRNQLSARKELQILSFNSW